MEPILVQNSLPLSPQEVASHSDSPSSDLSLSLNLPNRNVLLLKSEIFSADNSNEKSSDGAHKTFPLSCAEESYSTLTLPAHFGVGVKDNSFKFAHQFSFGCNPPVSRLPELIRLNMYSDNSDESSDEDDDDDFSSTDELPYVNELETLTENLPDVSSLTALQVLEKIDVPNFVSHEPDQENLNLFLDQSEVGHINHLSKCYVDSLINISVPASVFSGQAISPLDFIDVHLCGTLQVYTVLKRCKDFSNLSDKDQMSLLEAGLLPALTAIGIPLYECETKGWVIPSMLENTKPLFLPLFDLIQIFPKSTIYTVKKMHEIASKLNIDWTMSMIFVFILVYAVENTNSPECNKVTVSFLRDKYVHLLLKYLKWKFGLINAAFLLPEILKFLDSILRLAKEIQIIQLRLSDVEISVLNDRIASFYIRDETARPDALTIPAFSDRVSFESLNHRLIGVLFHLYGPHIAKKD